MRYKPVTVNKSKESGIAPILVIILIVIFIGLVLSPQVIKQSQRLLDNANPKKPLSIATFKVPTQTKSYEQLVAEGIISKAGKILQVDIEYDKAALSPLKITKLIKKNGYAPNVTTINDPYVAVLLDANNTVLHAVPFSASEMDLHEKVAENGKEIDTTKSKLIEENNTALILPLTPEVKTLQLRTSTGTVIATTDIATAQQVENTPKFETFMVSKPTSQKKGPAVTIQTTSNTVPQDRYLNIAMIGDKYTDKEKFHDDVTKMWNAMLQTEPYASRSDQILFHEVDNNPSLGCYAVHEVHGISYCDAQAAVKAVTDAGVPYDIIHVTVDEHDFGGIAGAITLGDSDLPVFYFTHEALGHRIGRLFDEGNVGIPYFEHLTEYFDQHPHGNGEDLYSSPDDGDCYAGTPPAKQWELLVKPDDYRKGCFFENWYSASQYSVMGGNFQKAIFTDCCNEAFNKPSQATIDRRLTKWLGRSAGSVGDNENGNTGSLTCNAPTRLQAALNMYDNATMSINWRGSSTPHATYEVSAMLKPAMGEGTFSVLPHVGSFYTPYEEQQKEPEPGDWTYKVRAKCGDNYSSEISTTVTVPTYTVIHDAGPPGLYKDPDPADIGKPVYGWDTNVHVYEDAQYYCSIRALLCQTYGISTHSGRLKIYGVFTGAGYIRSVDPINKTWVGCGDPDLEFSVDHLRCNSGGAGQYRFIQPGSNGIAGTKLP